MLTNIFLKLQTESREVGGLRQIASTRDEGGRGRRNKDCLLFVLCRYERAKGRREGEGVGLGGKTCERMLWFFLTADVFTVWGERGKC